MNAYTVLGTTIPANMSLSGEVDLGGMSLVGIEVPASWAGTAITFQSKSNKTEDLDASGNNNSPVWKNVYDDAGTEVSVVVGQNQIHVVGTVTKAAIGALRFLRLRSGSAASPVNQNPGKDIRLICKES